MSIAGIDFTQYPDCLLCQFDLLFGVLFQHRTSIQQAGPVSGCANRTICQYCRHFVDDRLHPGFITVLVHILEYIFQEQQIPGSIVLFDRCDDTFNGMEYLLVIHKFQTVHQTDLLQAVKQHRAAANRGFQFLHRNLTDHGVQQNLPIVLRVNKSHLHQIIDGIHVLLIHPYRKPSGGNAIGRNESHAAHNLLFTACELIETKQTMNMVIVGSFPVSAVFGGTDLIFCIQSGCFPFQFIQQRLGFQQTVCQ